MSIALHSLAEASLGQIATRESGKKAPTKRTALALKDLKAVPEPR